MHDDDLVRRARAGDIDAFASLVSRYKDCVYAFVRSRVEDGPAAEDVAQEVFISAHRALAKLEDATGVLPWLLGIARYKLLDHRRAARKRLPNLVGVELDDMPARPPPEDAEAVIASLLEGLPDEARAIA